MYTSESEQDLGRTSRATRDKTHQGVRVLPIDHDHERDDDLHASHEPSGPSLGGRDIREMVYGLRKGGWAGLLGRIFPCIGWMREYKWDEYLKADIVAGLTVGTMLVPQGMSYARLAGLHPIYGLYSSFIPVLVYVVFGSSRQLSVGPVAMVSLLVSNALLSVADPGLSEEEAQREYTKLAIQLAFLVGALECLMGVVQLGWLIRFISHSIVSGFTTASAVIIGLSQAQSFLGYDIARSSKLVTILRSIADGADGFKWQPFVFGSASLALLLLMKHLGKTYKRLMYMRAAGPLTAIVLGIAFMKAVRPEGVAVVGTVPRGFPGFSLGSIEFGRTTTMELLPHALLVSGVGILESVGIAKALAAKNGYEIDSNRELVGLGLCNLFGSAFSGAAPVAGSFSRSAVMNESGAKTGMAGLVVFGLIGAALLVLTPAFADVPQCGLAAIVVSAVLGLLDYDEALFLWRVEKRDLLLWVASCVLTLLFGIEVGVLVGVGLSLLFVVYESANPHTAMLGRLPGTTVYRNVEQYPDAYTYHGIEIIRVDAPMYFANIYAIKDRLRSCEHCKGRGRKRGRQTDRVSYIVFDMSPVTYIDSSAVHAIIELHYNCRARQIQVALCNPNRRVMTTLAHAGVPDLIGRQWYFVRVHDAVQTCLAHAQASTSRGPEEILEEDDVVVQVHDVPDHGISRRDHSRDHSWTSDSETKALLSDSSGPR